jgi:hypothetical protein
MQYALLRHMLKSIQVTVQLGAEPRFPETPSTKYNYSAAGETGPVAMFSHDLTKMTVKGCYVG